VLQTAAAWSSVDSDTTYSLAWGDVDGDGDLDLAAGNRDGPNKVYLNEGGVLQTIAAWSSADSDDTVSIAWGDVDGDGDLDLAAGNEFGPNKVYRNEEGALQTTAVWSSADSDNTYSVAWGDVDGDGDLDLAAGNGSTSNKVYLNEGGALQIVAAWSSADSDDTKSVAWGDVDGDGDLDLVAGNWSAPNKVYLNEGGVLQTAATWSSTDSDNTFSIAWGDVDGDGDLDLAAGNPLAPNKLYLNEGGVLQAAATWSSADSDNTFSIAWGDVDGDGDLDLAAGNDSGPNKVYLNEGGVLQTVATWSSSDSDSTFSVAWGDMDGDDDLDLAAGNGSGPNKVYLNEGSILQTTAWGSGDSDNTVSVAWGDVDGDGDLDLVAGNDSSPNKEYFNQRPADAIQVVGLPAAIHIELGSKPVPTFNQITTMLAPANLYAVPGIRQDETIPISYTLYHPGSEPVRQVRAFYSLNGGGQWLPAIATSSTVTTNLATAPYPQSEGNSHVFEWNVFASGLFGQSDNVVFRIEALPNLGPLPNAVPGPFQRPFVSTQTFPFRVRGNQIRVYSETVKTPANGALVYRLRPGEIIGNAYTDLRDQPYQTNLQGYLQGRGELLPGDQLVALLPVAASQQITFTDKFSLYHTSSTPTPFGLAMHPVITPGLQELIVSGANKLLLANLDVTLEWDARQDPTYLEQLERDIKQASEILYDLTNGQAALGRVRIFQAGENRLDSDIVIYASNNQRPNSNLGGVVSAPIDYKLANGEAITRSILPGQVRMGATWNRYGEPGGTTGEDWPRALAHELGHYLFFQLDNYLGISDDGFLIDTDCQGSAMTDAYRQDYSEFLSRTITNTEGFIWTGECLQTLAERTTGYSDWEIIREAFYPFLSDNITKTASGPTVLPLAVTQVSFITSTTASETLLTSPFFYIVAEDGNSLPQAGGQAEGYLYKTQNTETLTDDIVIPAGTPNGNLLLARGAASGDQVGDRVCIFDEQHDPTRLGCLDNITNLSSTLTLIELPGWQPQITVNPVNSTTIAISVTQSISPGNELWIQVLPTYGPITNTFAITAPAKALTPVNGSTFSQTFHFPYTLFSGHVRVWVSADNQGTPAVPRQETITRYFLTPGWDGNEFAAWTGNEFAAWTGNEFAAWTTNMSSWNAPVSSPDGQVTVYNLDNILGRDVAFALQALSDPPNLPGYLTLIGQAYRYKSSGPTTAQLAIEFQYLQRQLPFVKESDLSIYFLPDNGLGWQRLETNTDDLHNHSSTRMRGEGIYALTASYILPPLKQGWNLLPYPDTDTYPVMAALESINDDYTSIYHYDADRVPKWLLHDQTVLPEFRWLVNDLKTLEAENVYWIYAIRRTTPYIRVPSEEDTIASGNNLELPPATFYGWITPTTTFLPQEGDIVTALIDGRVCGTGTVSKFAPPPGTGPHHVYLPLVTNGAGSSSQFRERLIYKIQVSADIGNGCGVRGRTITFKVGNQIMPNDHPWGNNQACYHSLGVPSEKASQCFLIYQNYLPVFTRQVIPVQAPDLIVQSC